MHVENTYKISNIHDAVLSDVCAVNAKSQLNLLFLQALAAEQLLFVDTARLAGSGSSSSYDTLLLSGLWSGSNSLNSLWCLLNLLDL